MFYKMATVIGVSLCLALPAVAEDTNQSSNSTSTMQSSSNPGSNTVSIRQHLVQDLEKSGYTDVKITPASFVAEAKDKQGHPVTMLISPDSVTTIVMEPASSASANTGSTSTNPTNGSKSSTASNK